MIWILRNEEGRGFIQINGWVCEMNRIQHKKWIDTLGIGLFILTLLYMCGLTSNKDEIEIEHFQESIRIMMHTQRKIFQKEQ